MIPGLERSTGEGIGYPLQYSWASLVSSAVKESTHNVADLGSIPGLERSPGEGKGYLPTPVFWPGEFHGLYSLWGHKESDMIKQLLHKREERDFPDSPVVKILRFQCKGRFDPWSRHQDPMSCSVAKKI